MKKNKLYYFLSALRYYVANHIVASTPVEGLRLRYYSKIMKMAIGKKTHISMGIFITGYHDKCKITVGDNCVINRQCYLDGRSGIDIGNNVNISFQSCLITLHHDIQDPGFKAIGAPIRIHDHAWIGARAILLPGVSIGEGAVVAAGAVVTQDVAPYTVVAGVPARKIKERLNTVEYVTDFHPFFDTDIFDESKSL